jgi:hypothetical protein
MQPTTTRSIDTDGDGVADYTAIGTPLYLNKINLPSIKLNRTSVSTSTLHYSIGGRIEIYDFIKIVKGCDSTGSYQILTNVRRPSQDYYSYVYRDADLKRRPPSTNEYVYEVEETYPGAGFWAHLRYYLITNQPKSFGSDTNLLRVYPRGLMMKIR